jgi:hypothetical protein
MVEYGNKYCPFQQSRVPQADWLRLGLYLPRPRYTDRIYFSHKCLPNKGIILDATNQLEVPYFAEMDNICYRIQPCIVCIDIKYELNLKTFHNDCNRSYYIVSSIFLVIYT